MKFDMSKQHKKIRKTAFPEQFFLSKYRASPELSNHKTEFIVGNEMHGLGECVYVDKIMLR